MPFAPKSLSLPGCPYHISSWLSVSFASQCEIIRKILYKWQSFPSVLILCIQTFFTHVQEGFQLLYHLFLVVSGCSLPFATNINKDKGIHPIAVNWLKFYTIVEPVILEEIEEIKGIGFNCAWGAMQPLFTKLIQLFNGQHVFIMQEWWEWDFTIIVWDQTLERYLRVGAFHKTLGCWREVGQCPWREHG